MNRGKVEYGEFKSVKVLSFTGDIRYTVSPSLNRLLETICLQPVPTGFVIDLTQAESLDSTSLGLLARIAKWMHKNDAPKPTIISTNEDINDLLTGIGFDEVFTIVHRLIGKIDGTHELPLENGEKSDVSAVVLEAHRALSALNENNRRDFRDVVELLEAQEDQL